MLLLLTKTMVKQQFGKAYYMLPATTMAMHIAWVMLQEQED